MGCERDYQRTWLYRSEWELIDEFTELSLLECWDFLASAITKPQFVKQFPKTYDYLAKTGAKTAPQRKSIVRSSGSSTYTEVIVVVDSKLRPGYRRRYADACYSTITLPCWSRNKLTLLHELAHICCWCELNNGDVVSAHGKEFAGIYLLLVQQNLGKPAEKELFAAMQQHKVKVVAARDTIGTP